MKRKIYIYDTIDSTQKEMWRKFEAEELKGGEIIIAENQTSGIGTHGKTWYTDSKGDIAFSLYIKTNCEVSKLQGLTLEIAKIIVEIFKQKYNLTLQIKEPNDIVYNNKKIGGILTETKVYKDNVKGIVIGVGINTTKKEFTGELKGIATSIKNEFDIDIDNNIIFDIVNLVELKLKKIEE